MRRSTIYPLPLSTTRLCTADDPSRRRHVCPPLLQQRLPV